MENDLLLDSNVYIGLLRLRKDVSAVLYQWAESRRVNLAICGMVRIEVLRGITSPKLLQNITEFMDTMINIPSDHRLWQDATAIAWKLDRKGFVIPGADAVIAASGKRLGASVVTFDKHFRAVEGLDVMAPPPEWFS